jgi:hypothetical protein
LSATISVPGRERPSAPFEVVGVRTLVGVDEDQIERAAGLGGKGGQGVERATDAHLDDAGQTGTGDVGAGHLREAQLGLERDQPTAGRQRPPQPDRAVAAERADLEDRSRAL